MNLSDIATVEVSDNEICFKKSPIICSLFYWMRELCLLKNVTSLILKVEICIIYECIAVSDGLSFTET